MSKEYFSLIQSITLLFVITCELSCSKPNPPDSVASQEAINFYKSTSRKVLDQVGGNQRSKITFDWMNREIDCITGSVVMDETKNKAKASRWFLFDKGKIEVMDSKNKRFDDYTRDCGIRALELDKKLGREPGVAD